MVTLGRGVMVARRILTPLVGVQVPAPQLKLFTRLRAKSRLRAILLHPAEGAFRPLSSISAVVKVTIR